MPGCRTGITRARAVYLLEYAFWSTLSFTTVIPAVFGSAELISSFQFWKGVGSGPRIRPDRKTTLIFFLTGWLMFGLMWVWPETFLPICLDLGLFHPGADQCLAGQSHAGEYTGGRELATGAGALVGVLLTGFFWEMWNFFSFPKWIYRCRGGTAATSLRCRCWATGAICPSHWSSLRCTTWRRDFEGIRITSAG